MRTKGIGNLERDLETQASSLMEEFAPFTTGVRYLALLHRSKDGGENKEYHRRGGFYVTHTPEEYYDALVRLLTLQAVSSKPYRLYASSNSRNLDKAIHQYKVNILDADYASEENRLVFWQRLESRWVSALMSPSCRDTKLFMIDADGGEEVHAPVLKWLGERDIEILKQYKTPNGWHIITEPFNPNDFKIEGAEIKKDGLILLNAV